METQETLIVDASEANQRIDLYLAEKYPSFSRSYFQKLIQQGFVLINGSRTKKRVLTQIDDEIEVAFKLNEQTQVIPQNIPLEILYEDEFLLAANKPQGMVVHPACGNWDHTFVNALLYHCDILHDDTIRPGIVHRLDKDTSGVLLAAKTPQVHEALVQMFANREIEKTYIAITVGSFTSQVLQTYISRDPKKRQQMCVTDDGKEAITEVYHLGSYKDLSLAKLCPKTGRTHQLRVHMKYLNSPILGDCVYGSLSKNQSYHIDKQLLHAWKLKFKHPISKQVLEIKAPFPETMTKFLQFFHLDLSQL